MKTPTGRTTPSAGSTGGSSVQPREQWTGQLGFIISAIGSAVGLGNIWRFPGVAYENGGGAFLIPYLIALVTTGIPILFLDYALGHRFRGSVATVFHRVGGKIGRYTESVGWFQAAITFIIGLYYTVVVAWSLSYLMFSLDLRWGDDPASFFVNDYLQTGEPGISLQLVPAILIPLLVVWAAVVIVLIKGIARGLQRVNAIFLPLLVVGFGILVVRALFLPGAEVGMNALFTPNWAALADPGVWIAAYSQIFFSLSIAFGIMVTYSSYRRRRSNLTTPGLIVAFANSSFELLAGIGVFATLGFFALQQGVGINELENLTGVGLSFITFPAIISQMPGGTFFGILFFGSLAVAGFTSMLSVMQVVVASVEEKFNLHRTAAVLWVGGISMVLSVALFATTTGLFALDVVDEWVNNIGVVASAIITTVLVLWIMRRGPELRYHLNSLSTLAVGRWWIVLSGVLAPLVLSFMLIRRIITLVTEGYSDLPLWYLITLGWGSIAILIAAAVVLPRLRWRTPVDDFTAWPPWPAHSPVLPTAGEHPAGAEKPEAKGDRP